MKTKFKNHTFNLIVMSVFLSTIFLSGLSAEAAENDTHQLDIIASDGTVIPYSETESFGVGNVESVEGAYYEGSGEVVEGIVPEIPDDLIILDGVMPEEIIGTDDRVRVLDTTEFPYSTSAYIVTTYPNGKSYLGSGNLISSDTLLTAGHCVYNPDRGGWGTVKVYVGYDGITGEAPFGIASSKIIYSVSGWVNGSGSGYDFAVIKLDRPVGEQAGWLGYTDMESGNITMTGFPGEMGSRMYTMSGTIARVSDRNTYYTIDSTPGNSGSSVYNSDNKVVAIHAYASYYINMGTRLNYGLLRNINYLVSYGGNPGNIIDVSRNLSGAVTGHGWRFANDIYHVNGDVIITGTGTDRIVISGGSEAHPLQITLDQLTLDASGGPAICLQPGSHVVMTLKEDNVLKGKGLYGGIQTSDATLTIEADDEQASLDASGDDRGAGIGGSGAADGYKDGLAGGSGGDGGNGGTVIINSGIIAASSSFGAGIGGGKGGDGEDGRISWEGGDGGKGGNGANLTINGGSITAQSINGAAIGGGVRGYGGSGGPLLDRDGSNGVPGTLGQLALPDGYTFWTSPGGAGTVFPTTPFILNEDYRYVKIDEYRSIPAPSQPTLRLNKWMFLPGEEMTLSWNQCDNAHWYEVYISGRPGPEVKVSDASNTDWNVTSLNIDLGDFEPGTYVAWVKAVNVDSKGKKTSQSINMTFYIAEPVNQGAVIPVSLSSGLSRCYAFTPAQDGTYVFRSENKLVKYMLMGGGYPYEIVWSPNTYPEGSLYTPDMQKVEPLSDDNYGNQAHLGTYQNSNNYFLGGMDFIKKYQLKKDQTYIFAAHNLDEFNPIRHNTSEGAFDLIITRGASRDEAMPLGPDYNPSVVIDEPNLENYFVYTPDQSGVYTFESLDYGDQGPELTLYDADGTVLRNSRNSLWHLLEAGNTYYISGGLADGATGSYRLSIADEVYQAWTAGTAYEPGQVITYGSNPDGGPALYIVLQSHSSMSHWLPGSALSLYKYVNIPLWSQPIGIHDAYNTGDKVVYNGKVWVSDIDNNVWTPGITGWTVTDETADPPADPPAETAAWRQPLNSSDAYPLGARVLYNGKVWESTINANVWAPGVAGWIVIEQAEENSLTVNSSPEIEEPEDEEADPETEETPDSETEEVSPDSEIGEAVDSGTEDKEDEQAADS